MKRPLTKVTTFFPVASQRTPFTHFSMGRHAKPMPAAMETQDGTLYGARGEEIVVVEG